MRDPDHHDPEDESGDGHGPEDEPSDGHGPSGLTLLVAVVLVVAAGLFLSAKIGDMTPRRHRDAMSRRSWHITLRFGLPGAHGRKGLPVQVLLARFFHLL